jgi:hypothetical protein
MEYKHRGVILLFFGLFILYTPILLFQKELSGSLDVLNFIMVWLGFCILLLMSKWLLLRHNRIVGL